MGEVKAYFDIFGVLHLTSLTGSVDHSPHFKEQVIYSTNLFLVQLWPQVEFSIDYWSQVSSDSNPSQQLLKSPKRMGDNQSLPNQHN